MRFSEPLNQLLDDIGKLRECLDQTQNSEDAVDATIAYLLANQGPIEFFLKVAYENMTDDQRLELCKVHRELNEMSAFGHHHSTSRSALERAHTYWSGYVTDENLDDDLNLLWRGLAFAKYSGITAPQWQLVMQPLSKYLPQ
jgi:hypothetical protein